MGLGRAVQYTRGQGGGLCWVPAWAGVARDTKEGLTLLLWDFVLPKVLIIGKGEREGSV